MVKPADKIATYEDLFDLPENLVGEIFGGEIITHPRPAPKHARAASIIGATLSSRFDFKMTGDDSGWWIIDEPECHIGGDIVVPDIAGWRKKTMLELPDTAWFDISPDWVCEVLSPATEKYDRGVKRDIYARESVRFYCLVDPIEKMVEVFVLEHGNWMLLHTAIEDQVVGLPPFEGHEFDLTTIWA